MRIASDALEKIILYVCIFLIFIGVLLIGDVGTSQFNTKDYIKQIIWAVISLPFVAIAYFINLQQMRKLAFFLLILGIFLLVGVFIPGIGMRINDSQRWINLGPVGFQASTVSRLILIFYLAHYLSKNQAMIPESHPIAFVKNFLPIIIIPLIYLGLIYKEPDLSTAAILFFIYLSMLFVARIHVSTILLMLFLSLLLVTGALCFGPSYRRARYTTFAKFRRGEPIEKELEDKYCYQPKEGLIALSHGRWRGRGSEHSKAKLFYLPFAKTDYVFAILGEEYGFLGATFVMLLYVLLIFSCLTLAQRAENLFFTLIIAGFTFNLAYNVMINVSVVSCLIPSTGVTLPFISYGGSALLIDFVSIGIILNASRRARSLLEQTDSHYV